MIRSLATLVVALLAAVSPAAAQGAFESDDFNTCGGLDPRWSLVDPQGVGSVEILGAGTSNAQLAIRVAGGVTTDPWRTNRSVRVVQPASDVDFVAEMQIDSVPTERFQMVGLLVEQDADDWIRFDFYSDGSNLYAFAATTSGGSSSMKGRTGISASGSLRARITRVGDQWTHEFSTDGVTWTTNASFSHALVATAVGPFAASAGPNPPFEALIDFVFDASAPIVPEDGNAAGPPVVVTATAGAGGSVTVDPNQTSFNCGDVVTLTAAPDAGFEFVGWSGDVTSADNPLAIVATEDLSIQATFAPAGPPVISNVQVVPGAQSATVTWQTNEPATSRVDFGVSPAYGASESSSALVVEHEVVIAPLAPETVHHFSVTSVDDGGEASSSPDQMFATVGSLGPFSDDFSQCGPLASMWTFEDPVGGATHDFIGTGTSDAKLRIHLPAGASRDAWKSNDATRILQPADDGDFSVVAHFDSAVSGAHQLQGILIEQDASNWLRFDFYSDSSRSYVFSAVTDGGSSQSRYRSQVPSGIPLTMRVTRTGSNWLQEWSMDGGVTWLQGASYAEPIAVSRVGLFAGSAGSSAPAFTMIADYFFNAAAPIVPEDGPGGGGAFTIATSSTGGGTGTIALDPDQPTYGCGDVVTVTAQPSAGSAFAGWSGDLGGATNPETLVVSGDMTLAAEFVPAAPPVITGLTVTPGISDCVVRWATDVPATSRVDFGPTAAYGSSVEDSTLRTQHEFVLTGLTPGSDVHFEATSATAFGTDGTGDVVFTTLVSAGPTSDDFNTCAGLGDGWTLVDPVGGATASVVGAGTGAASVVLDVPGGSTRDPWNNNTSTRLMQPSDDRDLDLQVGFDSIPTQPIQMQGLLVEQDASNWLRFDFYYNGGAPRIFAAHTVSGSSSARINEPIPVVPGPIRMRVQRIGNLWIQSWSDDEGASWNIAATFDAAIDVSSVGVFAGTAGAKPPVSLGVDFFSEAAEPIAAEDGPIDAGPFVITEPGDGTVALVPQMAEYFCGEQVAITAVPPAGMLFSGWAGDLAGEPISTTVTMDGDLTATPIFEPTPAPVLSGVTVTRSSTSAFIRWSTDVPATSRIDYGMTTAYGMDVEESALVLEHGLALRGLTPGTTYHYQLTSESSGGLPGTTADAVFTTNAASLGLSDDFSASNLDLTAWTWVDPLGDSDLRIEQGPDGDSVLVIAVPAGRSHDAWESNRAARIQRPVPDVDLDVAVKMSGTLDSPFQSQGLIFSGPPTSGDFIRVDCYHTGSQLRAFAASTIAGDSTPRVTQTVASGTWSGDMFLRVQRTVDLWTVYFSTSVPEETLADPGHWSLVGSFNHPMELTSVGPFAGCGGSNPPAHSATFDWFYETTDPILFDDAVLPADVVPPFIYRSRVSVLGEDSARVYASTDEPTAAAVRIGLTPAYELGVTPSLASSSHGHAIDLTGLIPSTEYHYELATADAFGAESIVSGTFTTTAPGVGGGPEPQFEFWYADLQPDGSYRQSFGANGLGQWYCNVLGNVRDLDGEIIELRYSLEGGPWVDLNMGPDMRRLLSDGDFNVDLPVSSLTEGANLVTIEATDQWQNTAVADVVVDFTSSVIAAPDQTIDWNLVGEVTDVAQPIDGHWVIENGQLTTVGEGYDRLLAFGDVRWSDYEIEVPFTVHAINADGFQWPSGHPLLGFCLRWIQHSPPGEQPQHGFWPMGAIVYLAFDDVQGDGQIKLRGNFDTVVDQAALDFQVGVEHVMKAQVVTLPNGDAEYSFKTWRSGDVEPEWLVQILLPPGDPGDPDSNPAQGSPALVSHHLDVDFGAVRVRRLDQ